MRNIAAIILLTAVLIAGMAMPCCADNDAEQNERTDITDRKNVDVC